MTSRVQGKLAYEHKNSYGESVSLIQLRSFIEVYRRRSLSEAARALGLTQPAVSQHIASLESQLGRPLFERHARGVNATAIAEDLAASIGSGLDTAEAAFAAARARSAHLAGPVHLAAPSEMLAEYLAPRLLSLIDAGLELRLQIGGREALYAMLLEDKVHLGLTASHPIYPRLDHVVVGEEVLRAVAAPSIARHIGEMPLADGLHAVPHLAYDLERPLIRTWLEANRIELLHLPALTAPDLRTLRSALCAEIGWSVLPDYLTWQHIRDGQLEEITAPIASPRNRFYLVWARSSLRHPRVALARELVIRALREGS